MWKAVLIALLVLLGLTACEAAQASGSEMRAVPVSSHSMPAGAANVQQAQATPATKETPAANKGQGVEKNKTKGTEENETEDTEDNETAGTMVGVCHKTGSETNPYVYIQVSESALPAHEAHGDKVNVTSDACPKTTEDDTTEDEGTSDTKVGVCHLTGSQTNPYVYIQVSESALPAHEAHGDIVKVASADACPKTPPAVTSPNTQGKPDKDKEHGNKPDNPGSQGKGNGNGNGNGQDKDRGNGKSD